MVQCLGSVVQLVRMPPCHGGGRGFESRPVRNVLDQICAELSRDAQSKFQLLNKTHRLNKMLNDFR